MSKNSPIEILAPCGSIDALTAAVRSGADAVYIGLEKFSARAYADNFSGETLLSAAAYCRLHGVKLHTAVNTLVRDDEIRSALAAALEAYDAGADAFIVQDPGLAALIKAACPDAELHASTQMTIHTPEGARFLQSRGFDRVVLAREMSREEIAEIVGCCSIDTEVFVHGALCMCVSGQCYLSAMLGGRSGNRGRCAQPCRLPFSVEGGTGHDLSLKDNCIIDSLPDLASIGVTSAKIEGRMKRPEYVAAAVSACRKCVDSGRADEQQIARLRSVFSRSGFTSGYYTARTGRSMFGTRSKDDVAAATNSLLAEIRSEYKDEPRSNPVSFSLCVEHGKPSQLTAVSGDHSVTVQGAEPQTAERTPLSEEKARLQLQKTGGTAFYADEITASIDEGLTLPASALNAMRRSALDELTAKCSAAPSRRHVDVTIPKTIAHRRNGELRIRASFHSAVVPDAFKSCELVFVPLFSSAEELSSLVGRGFHVGVRIPRVIFGKEKLAEQVLRSARSLGISDVYCGNIGTAALAVRLGFNVHGGSSLNVFNTLSLKFLEESGICDTEVSAELTARQINALGGTLPRGIFGYGHMPLMIMRNCPNKNGAGCARCRGLSKISDRRGVDFPMMCEGGCTELLNSEPTVISDKLGEFTGADFLTLHFTYESERECEAVLRQYLHAEKPSGKFTRGLYFRGVE